MGFKTKTDNDSQYRISVWKSRLGVVNATIFDKNRDMFYPFYFIL